MMYLWGGDPVRSKAAPAPFHSDCGGGINIFDHPNPLFLHSLVRAISRTPALAGLIDVGLFPPRTHHGITA